MMLFWKRKDLMYGSQESCSRLSCERIKSREDSGASDRRKRENCEKMGIERRRRMMREEEDGVWI